MNCFSQEASTIISGKIISSNKAVENVHIINLSNKHGTISNSYGEFELNVIVNDTLLISSIQHKKIKVIIDSFHFEAKKIEIQLVSIVNDLEEVFIHGLTGNLNSDLNKTPIDTIPKHNFTFKLSDLKKKLPGDEYGYFERVNAESFTNPLYIRGGGQGSKFDRRLEALKKLKADLKSKKNFPSKIKADLGIDFFTKKLHIPEEKINHFLGYCEYKNIIELYQKNNLLEVIKILQAESKTYHEIKK